MLPKSLVVEIKEKHLAFLNIVNKMQFMWLTNSFAC